jgi:hypothetical protein
VLVRNIHHRTLRAHVQDVAPLLDGLASPKDALWPVESWPRMRFDRPLQVGAQGGHGPIRYSVVAYEPGRRVEFKFTGPRGFDGGHCFEVQAQDRGSKLIHTLEMNATGIAAITWPLAFEHLHDALVEDGLSKAQRYLNEQPLPVPWSPRVVLLRRVMAPLTRRRQ